MSRPSRRANNEGLPFNEEALKTVLDTYSLSNAGLLEWITSIKEILLHFKGSYFYPCRADPYISPIDWTVAGRHDNEIMAVADDAFDFYNGRRDNVDSWENKRAMILAAIRIFKAQESAHIWNRSAQTGAIETEYGLKAAVRLLATVIMEFHRPSSQRYFQSLLGALPSNPPTDDAVNDLQAKVAWQSDEIEDLRLRAADTAHEMARLQNQVNARRGAHVQNIEESVCGVLETLQKMKINICEQTSSGSSEE